MKWGSRRRREGATEGEEESTWEGEGDGGVEPGSGGEEVVRVLRHSRELTELQREVSCFD